MAQQTISAPAPTVQPVKLATASDWQIILRCFRYLRPYWRITAGTYLTTLAITAVALITPQFIRWIVDHGIRSQNRTLLAASVAGLLGLTLLKGLFTFLQGRWSEVSSQAVAYDLRNELYQKLANLSFAYHDRTETGQLLSRAIQDVDRIRFEDLAVELDGPGCLERTQQLADGLRRGVDVSG